MIYNLLREDQVVQLAPEKWSITLLPRHSFFFLYIYQNVQFRLWYLFFSYIFRNTSYYYLYLKVHENTRSFEMRNKIKDWETFPNKKGLGPGVKWIYQNYCPTYFFVIRYESKNFNISIRLVQSFQYNIFKAWCQNMVQR